MKMEWLAPALGRIFLAQIFLAAGWNKLRSWDQTAALITSRGMPLAPLLLAAAVLVEIGGALCIILGYKARFAALALFLFLIPTTLIFHNFWSYHGMEQQTQMAMFMKNLAIMGGLLLAAGCGPGPLSADRRN
jgi:putative oxidoreductase